MAHIEKVEEISEYEIYGIVSQYEKMIYINTTKSPNLRTVFKRHYDLKCSETKKMFEFGKEYNKIPKMYRLDAIVGTSMDAYYCSIAWGKYFKNHDYELISFNNLSGLAEKLVDRQKFYLETIDFLHLDSVLNPVNECKFEFKKGKRKNEIPNTISFRVNKDEYLKISRTAKSCGKNVSEFCKKRVLDGKTINVYLGAITKLIHASEEMNYLLYDILFYKKYLPEDKEKIKKWMAEMRTLSEEFKESFLETISETKKKKG